MDLSGLNNLVDIFGGETKKVMKGFNELEEIQGKIKSEIPDEYIDDCNEIFELSRKAKSSMSNDYDINNITDDLKSKMKTFTEKHNL